MKARFGMPKLEKTHQKGMNSLEKNSDVERSPVFNKEGLSFPVSGKIRILQV